MSDGRGAFLTCPGCRGPMAELIVGDTDVTVDVCSACRGVWFDWFDGETSSLARHLDTLSIRAAVGARGGGCPRDGAPLVEVPYLDVGPKVERCPTCFGVFAERPRIAALQAFHERMPQGPEPIERTSLLSRIWHAFVG